MHTEIENTTCYKKIINLIKSKYNINNYPRMLKPPSDDSKLYSIVYGKTDENDNDKRPVGYKQIDWVKNTITLNGHGGGQLVDEWRVPENVWLLIPHRDGLKLHIL